MPIVKTVKGNLLKMFKEDEFDAIVHGCNCFHTMGAGIAGQIAKEFPQAVLYDGLSPYGDPNKLGKFSSTLTEHGLIINAYTQFRPGREESWVVYTSIAEVFKIINNRLSNLSGEDIKVGIPLIGCGIAGGDWNIVKDIIDIYSPKLSIVVVEYDGS